MRKAPPPRRRLRPAADRRAGSGERKLIDASLDDGTPLRVTLGQGRVLKGLERGLRGVCEGDEVVVTIPPRLGFDEPGKTFQHKPVPAGTMVEYRARIAGVLKRGFVGALAFDLAHPVEAKWPALLALLLLLLVVRWAKRALAPVPHAKRQ